MTRQIVWVKVVGSGTRDDPYRADIPWLRMKHGWGAEIPVRVQKGHKHVGKPLVKYCRVSIDERDAPLVKGVPETKVPLHDYLLIDLMYQRNQGETLDALVERVRQRLSLPMALRIAEELQE